MSNAKSKKEQREQGWQFRIFDGGAVDRQKGFAYTGQQNNMKVF